MLKFAALDILDVRMATSGRLLKDAHRHEFDYQPKHGMLYVRSRMISSRCNDNWDEFPAEEIEKGWRSFVGKPVFVNHHNDDHRRARGVITDAALHRDRNPDGSPDTWVEGLMEIDALTFPKLAQAILAGHIERTSMGVDVAHSICTACGNKATTPMEYCAHVPGQKGKKLYRVTASGQRHGEHIREKCYGLGFFENSLLVEDPADPTAYFLGKPVAGPGLEHLSRTASVKTPEQSEFPVNWPASSRPVIPVDPRSLVEPQSIARTGSLRLVQASQCMACLTIDTVADTHGNAECFRCGNNWHEAALAAMPRVEAAKADEFFAQNEPHSDHVVEKFLHAYHNTPESYHAGMNWYEDSHNVAKVIGKGDAAKAAGLMGVYSAGTPVAPNYHYASRAIIHNTALGGTVNPLSGEDSDFHGKPNANTSQSEQARRILDGEHHSSVLFSPKVSNYAHLIEHGGDHPDSEKERVVVDRHAVSAAINRRITDKEFGSLGLSKNQTREDYQKDENGKRVRDENGNHIKRTVNDYGQDRNVHYQRLANVYREAAGRLRDMGHDVRAHQVQAVAWTVQKQRNDADDEAHVEAQGPLSGNIKGRQKSMNHQRDAWENHYETQHGNQSQPADPRRHWGKRGGASFRGAPVGASHVAYGETMAPAKVDTLRDENCPVCGEQDSWDGGTCAVCGFVAPPKAFQDPDLDMAKRIDLRKQQDDFDESMDPKELGPDGQPIGDVQPELVCNACGTEFPAAEPMTTDMDDPQAGADPMESDNPEEMEEGTQGGGTAAEGDVCPACGKGILETGTDLEAEEGPGAVPPGGNEEGAEPGEEEQDPDAEEDPDAVDPRDLVDEDDDPDQDDDEEAADDSDGDEDKPAKGKPFPKKK